MTVMPAAASTNAGTSHTRLASRIAACTSSQFATARWMTNPKPSTATTMPIAVSAAAAVRRPGTDGGYRRTS
jgi:hypothetical protein